MLILIITYIINNKIGLTFFFVGTSVYQIVIQNNDKKIIKKFS